MKYTTYFFIATLIFSKSLIAQVKTPILKIAIIDLRPWGYKENSQIIGQQKEVFQALSKTTGIEFEYHLLPLKRIKEYLISGKIEMASIF